MAWSSSDSERSRQAAQAEPIQQWFTRCAQGGPKTVKPTFTTAGAPPHSPQTFAQPPLQPRHCLLHGSSPKQAWHLFFMHAVETCGVSSCNMAGLAKYRQCRRILHISFTRAMAFALAGLKGLFGEGKPSTSQSLGCYRKGWPHGCWLTCLMPFSSIYLPNTEVRRGLGHVKLGENLLCSSALEPFSPIKTFQCHLSDLDRDQAMCYP